MNLSISKEAANWYKEELMLQDGDALCFFVRYGGESTIHKGFSLGIRKDTPIQAAAEAKENGITFYIEQDDEWYFDGHSLSISFKAGDEDPTFHFLK